VRQSRGARASLVFCDVICIHGARADGRRAFSAAGGKSRVKLKIRQKKHVNAHTQFNDMHGHVLAAALKSAILPRAAPARVTNLNIYDGAR
jgi:hypothetical protein